MNIRQSTLYAIAIERQLFVIDAQQMKDSGMKVVPADNCGQSPVSAPRQFHTDHGAPVIRPSDLSPAAPPPAFVPTVGNCEYCRQNVTLSTFRQMWSILFGQQVPTGSRSICCKFASGNQVTPMSIASIRPSSASEKRFRTVGNTPPMTTVAMNPTNSSG